MGTATPRLCEGEWLLATKWETATTGHITDAVMNGADVNEMNKLGRTPLMLAASYSRSPALLSQLLFHGASVKASTLSGWTALHCLTVNNLDHDGAPQMVQVLLDAGAEAAVANDQRQTPITIARRSSDVAGPAVARLLEKWERDGGSNQRVRKMWKKAATKAVLNPSKGMGGVLAAAKAAAAADKAVAEHEEEMALQEQEFAAVRKGAAP